MIGRLLEWYRIVNIQPSSDILDRRKAAILDLIQAWDDADDWDVILGAAAGVVAGFQHGNAQHSRAVGLMISSLKLHDSAFPQDLADNALELRATAAIALGELISRSPGDPPDDSAVFAALLLESGLVSRAYPTERYLKLMLEELGKAAKLTLASADRSRRQRPGTAGRMVLALDKAAAEVKALTTAIQAVLKEVTHQGELDREELDVLWWFFAGTSMTSGASLSSLDSGKAALVAGTDVANLCLLPPAVNADAFVLRAMQQVKSPDTGRPLSTIIAETDAATWGLLLPDEQAAKLGNDYPVLFPLTWLCHRLQDSGGAAGWSHEFETKTGLESRVHTDANTIAVQAFRERIAQRQYLSLIEE